ncbi:hypothetical protein ACHAXA_006284, partial [Cyclostephanos tholiformis]
CTPVPLRSCPNPQCVVAPPSSSSSQLPRNEHGGGDGGTRGCMLELLPMEFVEIDEARRVADQEARASWRAKEKSRAKKRAKLDGGGGADASDSANLDVDDALRTGRWTTEETAYCDRLILKFIAGRLPIPEGIKLNEFLSDMLKSKQSRLTKKMKNAKLSSKTFKRSSGYLADESEAREFSEYEDAFFHSLQSGLERAEMKFHIQKEWRETFSTYCVSHGQPLNVDKWLASVEEMEKRVHRAKDVERMHRRKMMMGHALRQDSQNPDRGVVIVSNGKNGGVVEETTHSGGDGDLSRDRIGASTQHRHGNGGSFVPNLIGSASTGNDHRLPPADAVASPSQPVASPFLQRVMSYMLRHNVPFEYIDAWVPSFVPDTSDEPSGSEDLATGEKSRCRLCFAGSLVATQVVVGEGAQRRSVPLSPDDQFNLSAFGDYSESFSFDVGCGLPGRVYHMGVPTWEQSVHNAPLHHFERVGGSQQWGIRTIVGIPVPSPNVGRIVVVLYSRHDRTKDHDLVIRLTEEFSRLMPSPKWKLVVDLGQPQPQSAPTTHHQQRALPTSQAGHTGYVVQQQRGQGMNVQQTHAASSTAFDHSKLTNEVISIFGEHMPSDPTNPAFQYLQGFMSLRLLLLRSTRNEQEQDLVNTILSSYSSYKAGMRSRPDIALMLARDFMFLNPQAQAQSKLVQHQQFAHHSYNAPAPTHQMHTQQTQNYTYSPATSNNMYSMPPPPSSPNRSSNGSIVNIEHKSNPNNVYSTHVQDLQQHHTSIQQQQEQLSHELPTYSHDSIQLQPQSYHHSDNNVSSMLNDLLSIPQNVLASTAATAGATCAATGEEEPLALSRFLESINK